MVFCDVVERSRGVSKWSSGILRNLFSVLMRSEAGFNVVSQVVLFWVTWSVPSSSGDHVVSKTRTPFLARKMKASYQVWTGGVPIPLVAGRLFFCLRGVL